MGLDAVVYRNRQHLQLELDETAGQLIPETGEVYFESDEISRKYLHKRHAVKHRLGNLAEIAALRSEVTQFGAPKDILLEKVLYSGSHSGDFIPLELLPLLSAEIKSIYNSSGASSELLEFLGSMEDLIRAAKDEGNPIVFV
jgi:hypothetical protein